MPALWILIAVIIIISFFLLSWLYKPIGKFVRRIIKDTNKIIMEVDEEKEIENE